jgi:hypothetical protein
MARLRLVTPSYNRYNRAVRFMKKARRESNASLYLSL